MGSEVEHFYQALGDAIFAGRRSALSSDSFSKTEGRSSLRYGTPGGWPSGLCGIQGSIGGSDSDLCSSVFSMWLLS